MLFGQLLFGKWFSKWLLVYFWRENLPPLEEFHLDLHGSGVFYIWLIDLHGVCIKFTKLAPNVLKPYLLLFIHKFILFALTANAIIIFIMYLYMYLLKYWYLLEFSVVYIFWSEMYLFNFKCIYFSFSGMYLFQLYFYYIYWTYIYLFIYLLIFIINIYWVGFNFLLFNTCTIKFIEGKFYFEGRACYIGKILPTCIE